MNRCVQINTVSTVVPVQPRDVHYTQSLSVTVWQHWYPRHVLDDLQNTVNSSLVHSVLIPQIAQNTPIILKNGSLIN